MGYSSVVEGVASILAKLPAARRGRKRDQTQLHLNNITMPMYSASVREPRARIKGPRPHTLLPSLTPMSLSESLRWAKQWQKRNLPQATSACPGHPILLTSTKGQIPVTFLAGTGRTKLQRAAKTVACPQPFHHQKLPAGVKRSGHRIWPRAGPGRPGSWLNRVASVCPSRCTPRA